MSFQSDTTPGLLIRLQLAAWHSANSVKPFLWLPAIVLALGGVCAIGLFLWLINSTYVYASPKKQVEHYTHVPLSDTTSFNRYCVRNFFLLDGPDFYFEVTLSRDDKARLIKFFKENQEVKTSTKLEELVPASWKPLPKKLEHYFVGDQSRSVSMWLAVDADGDKAWLVIWNE
jgi:hypothetical protein